MSTFVGSSAGEGAISFPAAFTALSAADKAKCRAIFWVAGKPSTTGPSSLNQGWTSLVGGTGGTGAPGADVGVVYVQFHGKDLGAAEVAPTLTVGSGHTNGAWGMVIYKRDGVAWAHTLAQLAADYIRFGSDVSGADALTAAVSSEFATAAKAGDTIVTIGAMPTDAGASLSVESSSAPGLAGGVHTPRHYFDTAFGSDFGISAGEWTAFTGTATGPVTVSHTIAGVSPTGCVAAILLRELEAPGVPTNVTATYGTPPTSAVDLAWDAPATGGAVAGYHVRVDYPTDPGDPIDAGLVETYGFTGLTPDTTFVFGVRAYNAAGNSAWVDIEVPTLPAGPDVPYVADIRVGTHLWSIESGGEPGIDDVNVLAGATFSWSAPDDVGWPPSPWTMPYDTLTLRLHAPTAADVADIARLDVCRFRFTPIGYEFDAPLIDFAGVVYGDPRIVPAARGGVYIDVTAVDWRLVLALVTVFGLAATDGDGLNGEAAAGEWHVITPGYSAIQLWEGASAGGPPGWAGVDGWVSEALDTHLRGLPWLHDLLDVDLYGDIDDLSVAALGDDYPELGLEVLYEYGSDLVTLHEVLRQLGSGAYPWPMFNDANGDLLGFRWKYVWPSGVPEEAPFGFSTLPAPNVFRTLDASKVLAEVEWRRGFCPDVLEVRVGDGMDRYWTGFDYVAEPENPETQPKRVSDADIRTGEFNLAGFTHELPTPSTWSLYRATVLGYLDPETCRGFFTYPGRVMLVLTIENIEPDRDPTPIGSGHKIYGRLGRAEFRLGPDGRWVVDIRVRPRLPQPVQVELGLIEE